MWTVRNGEFQSKSKGSRLCKDCNFCAGWCICHGESCWLSGLCVGMCLPVTMRGHIQSDLEWYSYFVIILILPMPLFLEAFSEAWFLLAVFPSYLMSSLILATNLREAIPKWAGLGKSLAVSLLSLPRPFCCLFFYLGLLKVIRKMATILSFTITDGFL